jgi:hypothetical protein
MSTPQPWVALSADDLLSSMTLRERDLFGKVSVSISVPDRVTPILRDLVNEIRGYIGSHSRNTLSADPLLIPSEFVAKAMAIARWRALATLPSGYQIEGPRKDEYDKADAFFVSVAKGVIRPSPAPDAEANPVPSEKLAGVEVVSSAPSRTGRARMDGL